MNDSTVIILAFGTIVPSVRSVLRDRDLDPRLKKELVQRLPEIDTVTMHGGSAAAVSPDLGDLITRFLDIAWPVSDLVQLLERLHRQGYRVMAILPPALDETAEVRRRLDARLAALDLPVETYIGFSLNDVPDGAVVIAENALEAERCLRKGRHAIIYVDPARLAREIDLRRLAATPAGAKGIVE